MVNYKMLTVYALELKNGKYYIGKTSNMESRYRAHCSGYMSSAWTRKYKPVRIVETLENAHCLDEDKLTIIYMVKYGHENVRGGPYVSIKLSVETISHITTRIRMAYDKCIRCGKNGHFGNKCIEKKSTTTIDEIPVCGVCNSKFHFTEDCEFSEELSHYL